MLCVITIWGLNELVPTLQLIRISCSTRCRCFFCMMRNFQTEIDIQRWDGRRKAKPEEGKTKKSFSDIDSEKLNYNFCSACCRNIWIIQDSFFLSCMFWWRVTTAILTCWKQNFHLTWNKAKDFKQILMSISLSVYFHLSIK